MEFNKPIRGSGLSTFCVKDWSRNSRWVFYKVCHFEALGVYRTIPMDGC